MDDQSLTNTLYNDDNSFILTLEFEEDKYPFLQSVSSLLYDFELAHDFSVLLSYPQYESYEFSDEFWYRRGRELEPMHRLRVYTIAKRSPLTIELIFGAIDAAWALIQIITTVYNWKKNREIKDLTAEKIKLEIEKMKRELEHETTLKLKSPRIDRIRSALINRLDSSPIKLVTISLRRAKEPNPGDDPTSSSINGGSGPASPNSSENETEAVASSESIYSPALAT